MADRFCMYCQNFKPDEGFKFVFHTPSNTRRGMCPVCQARRKLPRVQLNKMAVDERAARREQASIIAKKADEAKYENNNSERSPLRGAA